LLPLDLDCGDKLVHRLDAIHAVVLFHLDALTHHVEPPRRETVERATASEGDHPGRLEVADVDEAVAETFLGAPGYSRKLRRRIRDSNTPANGVFSGAEVGTGVGTTRAQASSFE
jgi:hypothetical protein